MVPTRQCSPLTHQWITWWGRTPAQWRISGESLQRQWLYQVRREPCTLIYSDHTKSSYILDHTSCLLPHRLFYNLVDPLSAPVHHSLPLIWNSGNFLTGYLQLWHGQPISKLFEANTQLKPGGHFFLVFMKKLCVWQPFFNFITAHKLVPPLLAFSSSHVNGNVWPKLITAK